MTSPSGRSSGFHTDAVAPTAGSIVSGERIIRALYSVADLRQARALSDEDVRCALAIADALGELAAEKVSGPFRKGIYASADLAMDPATSVALGAKSGATPRQVDRGLELLLATQVLLRVPGRAEFRLARECLVDIRTSFLGAPVSQVRESLVARRAALMPALGVLRYLRELAPDATGWVVTSLEQAAARTFFKRSTVARALVDLESAGAVERGHGPGLRGHYRIVARAAETPIEDTETDSIAYHGLGISHGRAAAPEIADRRPTGAPLFGDGLLERDARRVTISAHGGTSAAADMAMEPPAAAPGPGGYDSAPVIEISGVGFPIPPGATLTPEFDSDGRLWYRLGSARIGPIVL